MLKGVILSEIELIFEKLFDFYMVGDIKSLAQKLNTAPSTVSNWKQRNSVNAIKKKCRELGIYNDIFGDIQNNDLSNAKLHTSVGVNNGTSTINSSSLSNNIPDYILDDLGSLFKRCKDRKDELIDALDNFIFEQKKKCR